MGDLAGVERLSLPILSYQTITHLSSASTPRPGCQVEKQNVSLPFPGGLSQGGETLFLFQGNEIGVTTFGKRSEWGWFSEAEAS